MAKCKSLNKASSKAKAPAKQGQTTALWLTHQYAAATAAANNPPTTPPPLPTP